jgi:GNAT superfamily N-acetyltransferase
MDIRNAHRTEASLLTDIAVRSKASWGYDADFMQNCVEALSVREEDFVDPRHIIRVIEEVKICGFYHVELIDSKSAVLDALFIDTPNLRKGLGTLLFKDAIEQIRVHGCHIVRIQSDPYAQGFYEAMGATRVGMVPSESIPGRDLPLFEYSITK